MGCILITWTSWFIWFHTALSLLNKWFEVIWVDNENDYYDIELKKNRREQLCKYSSFHFYKYDLLDRVSLENIFATHKIEKVCHLAAQAWVRYSIENPQAYIDSNVSWFFNIIDLSKKYKISSFVYASSSSIYWNNKKIPLSVDDKTDNPISLYAATKKSNELFAHTYSHLFWLRTIGLRFFTVYWPWWRPDMAYFKFSNNIVNNKPIDIYNNWKMLRDFTYIDDIVDGIYKALIYNKTKYEIFNLWNDAPVELNNFIEVLEKKLWKEVHKNYLGMQQWDVEKTWSDIEHTKQLLWWKPQIWIDEWLENFVVWYKEYYNI